MRKLITLIIVISIFSCKKEKPEVMLTPMPGWSIENLNENYYIQFPKNYSGIGFKNNCFFKVNPSNDIIINQCYCCVYDALECIGDTLTFPFPNEITRLPFGAASYFVSLVNKEQIIDSDSIINGILYYSDGFKLDNEDKYIIDALYYKKVADKYISMLRLQYNKEKIDTIQLILNTIEKK